MGLELQKNVFSHDLPIVVATQTKGESWALGWNAAANYAFDAKNELGIVYRSKVTHTMDADFRGYGIPAGLGGDHFTKAHGKVTLPDSWAIGYNHKFDDRTRVELNGTYTKWSSYDALNITFDEPFLGNAGSPSPKTGAMAGVMLSAPSIS